VRRATGIAVLVLAAILLEVLAVGTPVANDDSVAAVTAGISPSTAPAPRSSGAAGVRAAIVPIRSLVALLVVALMGAIAILALSNPPPDLQSIRRWTATGRRGPPTTA